MTADVLVRAATVDDFDRLIALFTEVAEERLWIGTEPGFSHDDYRSGWRRLVEEDAGVLFVALQGELFVGTLSIHPDSEHGCEVGMLVKREYRRKGVGAALLRAAIHWGRRQCRPALSLLVFPHNTAAIALYERYRFETRRRIAGFKRRQNGEVWDVLLMVLPLGKR
jgi:ribosomal protein S18 acetylase RimI-like enzyme